MADHGHDVHYRDIDQYDPDDQEQTQEYVEDRHRDHHEEDEYHELEREQEPEPAREEEQTLAPKPTPLKSKRISVSRLPVLSSRIHSGSVTSPLASPVYPPEPGKLPTIAKRGTGSRAPGGRVASSGSTHNAGTLSSTAKMSNRRSQSNLHSAAASSAPLTPALAPGVKPRAHSSSLNKITTPRKTSGAAPTPALNPPKLRSSSSTSPTTTPKSISSTSLRIAARKASTEERIRGRSPGSDLAPSTPKTPRVPDIARTSSRGPPPLPLVKSPKQKKKESPPAESPRKTHIAASQSLREQIAAARAAAKKQRADSIGKPGSSDGYNMDTADPFNLGIEPSTNEKILMQRIKSARFEGRLNISNLMLKEIPESVYKMYEMVPEDLKGVDEAEEDGPAWYETVDLTKMVAADNEIEEISDELVQQFGALASLDLHNNALKMIPANFKELTQLTSLHLTNNELSNEMLDIIFGIESLKELKLAKNKLTGELSSSIFKLSSLEVLELQENQLTDLPNSMSALTKLRVLNLSKNKFSTLDIDVVAKSIQELDLSGNRLSGTFFPSSLETLPNLQLLNVSTNALTALADNHIALPALTQLFASNNRLKAAPSLEGWNSLLVLVLDQNCIEELPECLFSLEKLRTLDVSGNDIRALDARLGAMESLELINFAGNPLRERNLASMSTDDLKRTLRGRLAPPEIAITGAEEETTVEEALNMDGAEEDAEPVYQVSRNGTLDLSNKDLTELPELPESCHSADNLLLIHNSLTTIPSGVAAFTALTNLSLSHNPLAAEYLTEELSLPALTHLTLHSCRITTLMPLYTSLSAPSLMTLDVSANSIVDFAGLMKAFPKLTVFLAMDNKIAEIDLDSVRGLRTLDLTGNALTRLEPKLSLLPDLRELRVQGNLFRVPRWQILEKGSEATLSWLRERVPVEELEGEEGEREDELD